MNGLQIIGVLGSAVCIVSSMYFYSMMQRDGAGSAAAKTVGVLIIGTLVFILVFALGRMTQKPPRR